MIQKTGNKNQFFEKTGAATASIPHTPILSNFSFILEELHTIKRRKESANWSAFLAFKLWRKAREISGQ